MADDKHKQEGTGSRIQIVVAVIGLVGVLGAAMLKSGENIRLSSSTEPPPGNYQLTCPTRSVKDNILTATCNDGNGHWSESTLVDFKRCQFGIENINGRLECRKP